VQEERLQRILGRVERVSRVTFGDPKLILTMETTADDIPGWDSLAHVAFIAAVEVEFRARFSIGEVAALDSIGDLVNLVALRTQAEL
jgi:acyl carrier protein